MMIQSIIWKKNSSLLLKQILPKVLLWLFTSEVKVAKILVNRRIHVDLLTSLWMELIDLSTNGDTMLSLWTPKQVSEIVIGWSTWLCFTQHTFIIFTLFLFFSCYVIVVFNLHANSDIGISINLSGNMTQREVIKSRMSFVIAGFWSIYFVFIKLLICLSPYLSLMLMKNAIVIRVLNFRVHLLLKRGMSIIFN